MSIFSMLVCLLLLPLNFLTRSLTFFLPLASGNVYYHIIIDNNLKKRDLVDFF